MIKLPFHRKPKDDGSDKPSVAFANYCNGELERRRDSGVDLDEERFRAAVELAVGRLRETEEEGEV